MNYTDLVATKSTANSIKGWLNWDAAPATDILTEAQAEIYSRLRVREMRYLVTGTITLNDTTLTLPSDYIAAMSFRRAGPTAGKIRILDPQHFESRWPADDSLALPQQPPTECMILAGTVYFNARCNNGGVTIPYRLVHFRSLPALAGGNLTNFLTDRYPRLLRAACMLAGSEFKKEWDAVSKWEKRLEEHVYTANENNDAHENVNDYAAYWDGED